jgi:hypothetical protein
LGIGEVRFDCLRGCRCSGRRRARLTHAVLALHAVGGLGRAGVRNLTAKELLPPGGDCALTRGRGRDRGGDCDEWRRAEATPARSRKLDATGLCNQRGRLLGRRRRKLDAAGGLRRPYTVESDWSGERRHGEERR